MPLLLFSFCNQPVAKCIRLHKVTKCNVNTINLNFYFKFTWIETEGMGKKRKK